MGVDGHIFVLKIEDKEWWKNGGDEELKQYVRDYYNKNDILWRNLVYAPYYYENFLGVEGLDVLIFYYDSVTMGFMEQGLYAIDRKQFDEHFKGKLKRIGVYEVWT